MESFGELLREYRKASGLTQGELANGLCSISYVSQLECGHRWVMSREILSGFMGRLGLGISGRFKLLLAWAWDPRWGGVTECELSRVLEAIDERVGIERSTGGRGMVSVMKGRYFLVFDVESVGLHGEAFAVAYAVFERETRREVSSKVYHCPISAAEGGEVDRKWVLANVPVVSGKHVLTVESPRRVRELFWADWDKWRASGAVLVADCAWPVESRFLCACVDANRGERGWSGPYPLLDVGSVRYAAGLDPLADEERLASELPKHDPLCDVRQSARLFFEALEVIENAKASFDRELKALRKFVREGTK